MATLPTPDELVQTGQGVYRTALDPQGTGAVDLRPGSRNDTALSVQAALTTRLSAYVADRLAAALTASAEGDDLDVRAQDLYQETRRPAVASVGTLYLARVSTGATAIPKGSRFGVPATSSRAGVVFEATADVAVASGGLKAAVAVQCTEAGTRGNVALSAVTAVLDPLPDTGWSLYVPTFGDPVLVGGPVDVIGRGAEVEQDDDLRARLAETATDTSRQRGTRAAILRGARRVPGVASAVVIEPADGTVVVYAGDASDALPAALRAAIDTDLLAWRAYGVPCLVRAFEVSVVTVTGTVYMARALADYDVAAIKAAAVAAVQRYFATGRPSPDEYFLSAVEAACFEAHDEVQDVEITAPASSVLRPADADYGAVVALTRYRVTDASITLAVLGPRTA